MGWPGCPPRPLPGSLCLWPDGLRHRCESPVSHCAHTPSSWEGGGCGCPGWVGETCSAQLRTHHPADSATKVFPCSSSRQRRQAAPSAATGQPTSARSASSIRGAELLLRTARSWPPRPGEEALSSLSSGISAAQRLHAAPPTPPQGSPGGMLRRFPSTIERLPPQPPPPLEEGEWGFPLSRRIWN